MEASFQVAVANSSARLSSVLIIEADHQVRNFLSRSLYGYFALVESCERLSDAIELQRRCHFDLLIADTAADAQSTLDWVRELRQAGELLGVILLAENADIEMALTALRLDVQDLLAKPFDIEQLQSSLENFVERRRCRMENKALRRQVQNLFNASAIIGESLPMRNLFKVIERVAATSSTVLIEGESGTGKELAARALHDFSGRKGAFVPINCGGMSAELMESELFGHVRGAFTGAAQAREGLFSFADKGTLFLDEIGEMPLPMQAHLLRVLESRSIRPVGSNREIAVDVRIVAATNRDLQQMVKQGKFRRDLFYRLNVITISMPPLRQRSEDIPLLAQYFCKSLSVDLGVQPTAVAEAEIQHLTSYDWPGNVRELKNVIERCLLLNLSPSVCLSVSPNAESASTDVNNNDNELSLLEEVEKRHILRILNRQGGNKSAASRELGISRKTLERKIKAWELD